MGRFVLALVGALVLLLLCSSLNRTAPIIPDLERAGASYGGRFVERIRFAAFEELSPLAERLAYTNETWASGQLEIPRLVLTRIPARFGDVTVNEVTVAEKKWIFFRMVLPLILIANEDVMADRAALSGIRATLAEKRRLSADELTELRRLADAYDVSMEGDALSLTRIVQELERRIDVVPPSLALAQAATESAWGTSRFALEGNALFGQWTFGRRGIRPAQQRSGIGDYKVASFPTLLESVRSYLENLNTNPAYREFRELRAEARARDTTPSGSALVGTLIRYSERREAYIEELRDIMAINDLSRLDQSRLADGTVYELTPSREAES